jgi:iduronate 2-sulfatase
MMCRHSTAVIFLFLIILNLYSQEKEKKYNVLFIVVDDLRTELASYGVNNVISPNIDSLANVSTVFKNAYCQFALCSPSRYSFLTGLRPDSIRIHDLSTNIRETTPETVTLPQLFKNNGYYSVGVGKIFHDTKNDPESWNESFQNFPRRYATGPPFSKELGTAYENEDVDDNMYMDGFVTLKALEKLSEMESNFFLGIGFYKPHLPFNSPKKYWDFYDNIPIDLAKIKTPPTGSHPYSVVDTGELRSYLGIPKEGEIGDELSYNLKRAYYACISYVDNQVGLVLKKMRELNLDKIPSSSLQVTMDTNLGNTDYGESIQTVNLTPKYRCLFIIQIMKQRL